MNNIETGFIPPLTKEELEAIPFEKWTQLERDMARYHESVEMILSDGERKMTQGLVDRTRDRAMSAVMAGKLNDERFAREKIEEIRRKYSRNVEDFMK